MIVVDIQPAYEHAINFVDKFVDHINQYKDPILYLYNGPTIEGESKDVIVDWLSEKGVKSFDRIHFYQKDYGFIRDGLDNYGYLDVYNILKYLKERKIFHSKELTSADFDILYLTNIDGSFLSGIEENRFKLDLRPDIMRLLKKYENGSICGGKADRCLLEIVCLMDAFDMKYKKNKKFIYS